MRAFVCLLYMVVILVNVPMTYGLSDNSEEAIGPEDIKSLTWTTTESCLPLVELECPEIIDFLREYIFPIYRNNNGDKDYDRIYLIIYEEDNDTRINLILYLHDKRELTGDSVYWKGYEHSVAIIEDIRVIVISEKTCSYIKTKGDCTVCFKAIKDLLVINDACAEWDFRIKNGDLVLVDFRDWGINWLKNLKMEKYIPNFKPIKRMYNHKRKFSLFREAGLSTPPWLPDSMKINEPYSGF